MTVLINHPHPDDTGDWAVCDTYIVENSETNYGTIHSLLVGEIASKAARSLLRFHLEASPHDRGIPRPADIIAATLRIEATDGENPSQGVIHAMDNISSGARNWVEIEATWTKARTSFPPINWTTPGGDMKADKYTLFTQPIIEISPVFVYLDVLSLVKYWWDDDYDEVSFEIKSSEPGGTDIRWYTGGDSGLESRPLLQVIYNPHHRDHGAHGIRNPWAQKFYHGETTLG